MPAPEAGFSPQVTLHMIPELLPAPAGRKVAFGTPEFRVVPAEWRRAAPSGADVDSTVGVMTPSRWSALAFERFGLPRERIHVVPHGIDPAMFRPDAPSRVATRHELGLAPDTFVFLNVGAMTDNKGIDLLLDAFARVAERRPATRLVLKGSDAVYGSQALLRRKLDALDEALRRRVVDRLTYIGRTLSMADLAALLRAADCYVSPYLAEGFNMPVLEAAACGVPVICTAGGATDDFTDASFALPIRSRPVHVRMPDGQLGDALMPDRDHLVSLMLEAADDRAAMIARGERGAAQVASRFTWDAVTNLLVNRLFP
jgi:glycosyltransferase involved in cell wall biosynthesis